MNFQLYKLSTFFSLFVFSLSLSAQKDTTKQAAHPYVAVEGGIGISPRAMFMPSSGTTWGDYIKPGFTFDISGGLPLFHSHFGVAAGYSLYNNSFDMVKYLKNIENPKSSGTYSSVSYGGFLQNVITAGAFASFTFGKVGILLRGTGGIVLLSLPNTAWNLSYPPPVNISVTTTDIYTTSVAAVVDGSVGVTYKLGKGFSLLANLGVIISDVSYKDTEYQQSTVLYTSYFSGVAEMFVFSARLGACYTFGK